MTIKSIRDGSISAMFQGVPFFRRFAGLYSASSSDSAPINDGPESHLLEVVGRGRSYEQLVDLENSGEIFQARLLYMVKGLALEAAEFGAQELFIGHPREYRYEFFVKEVGYQGVIEPEEYSSLLRIFGKETELEFQVEHFEIEALTLSLTSNHLNPVVHVGWRRRWIDEDIASNQFQQ